MSTEPQILNYAGSEKKPGRSRILFVIFPYGAGLVIGGFLSLLMLWFAPDFVPFGRLWDGYLYSTGPFVPNEIGPDGWGRTRVVVPGLPYHYIANQRDSRHFIVGSDVD